MGRPPKTEHWPAIQRCCEMGVPVPDVAKKFEISADAIYQQAKRKNWLMPGRLEKAVKARREADQSNSQICESEGLSEVCQQEGSLLSESAADELIVANLDKTGQQIRATAAKIALSGLKKVSAAPPEVETWQDVKILTELGLKATGSLGELGPSVSIMFGELPPLPPVIDIGMSQADKSGD